MLYTSNLTSKRFVQMGFESLFRDSNLGQCHLRLQPRMAVPGLKSHAFWPTTWLLRRQLLTWQWRWARNLASPPAQRSPPCGHCHDGCLNISKDGSVTSSQSCTPLILRSKTKSGPFRLFSVFVSLPESTRDFNPSSQHFCMDNSSDTWR